MIFPKTAINTHKILKPKASPRPKNPIPTASSVSTCEHWLCMIHTAQSTTNTLQPDKQHINLWYYLVESLYATMCSIKLDPWVHLSIYTLKHLIWNPHNTTLWLCSRNWESLYNFEPLEWCFESITDPSYVEPCLPLINIRPCRCNTSTKHHSSILLFWKTLSSILWTSSFDSCFISKNLWDPFFLAIT